MTKSGPERYREYVKRRINDILPAIAKASVGDFSGKIEVSEEEEEEFLKLIVGLNMMIDDIQYHVAELKRFQKEHEEANKEKIKRLEKELKEAEDFRVATINILEDLDEGRKELEQAYEELKSINEMKSEFLAMTAHELKTPLTPMTGFVQLMLSRNLGEISKDQEEGLKTVFQETQRLKSTFDKIMEISKLESGKVKPYIADVFKQKDLQLGDVIRDTIKSMKHSASQKKIALTSKTTKLPLIMGHREYLKHVLDNLIDNAIKFTPEGGKVSIEAEEKEDHILVKVNDNGPGIAKEDIPKLFERGFQADHCVPGIGLGLPICQKIVHEHNGKIWVESELGKGSTFYFTLPKLRPT